MGAHDGLREAIRAPIPPSDKARYELNVAAAKRALGEPEFGAAYAEGRALPLDAAIKLALEEEGTGAPDAVSGAPVPNSDGKPP